MQINNIMLSGKVLRYHSVPGITGQTVADHSWGVCALLYKFYPDAPKVVFKHALLHDCAELHTGDIPAPVKWSNHELHLKLIDFETEIENAMGVHLPLIGDNRDIVKICDCLEGMTYCLHRANCGELMASDPFWKWVGFLEGAEFDLRSDVLEYIARLTGAMINLGLGDKNDSK